MANSDVSQNLLWSNWYKLQVAREDINQRFMIIGGEI